MNPRIVFATHALRAFTALHSASGWFVVGGGRNGMEYSALLIACLAIVAVLDPAVRSAKRGRA